MTRNGMSFSLAGLDLSRFSWFVGVDRVLFNRCWFSVREAADDATRRTGKLMSVLDRLKSDWESLARCDALSAILTDDSKAAGRWSIEEFMATGDAELGTVMRHLAGLQYVPNSSDAALDFGCGVGRVTQALARHFASCIGIDISQEMIQKADSLNRYGHCRYVANSSERLPFPDASFSFIYSNIVLQHIPRRLSKGYLKELVRVLAPGGVFVFGVQDSFAAPDALSLLIRIRHILHIRSRLKVALGLGPGDMQMHCLPEKMVRDALGSVKILDIQLTNTAARDFNGRLVYLQEAPKSGYVGKQYCVVKQSQEH
jgi:SAM-dependent methyltransferase